MAGWDTLENLLYQEVIPNYKYCAFCAMSKQYCHDQALHLKRRDWGKTEKFPC